MKLECDIYIPIVAWRKDNSYPTKQSQIIINEISEFSKIKQFKCDSNLYNYSFKLSIEEVMPKDLMIYFLNQYWIYTLKEQVLRFVFSADIDFLTYKSYLEQLNDRIFSDNEAIELINSGFSYNCQEQVFKIIASTQIAKPGCIKLREGIVVSQGRKVDDITGTALLDESYEFCKDLRYPQIRFLNFSDVWNWLEENNLLFKDEPTTKLAIALNAYTYIYKFKYSPEQQLVYIMMGLEALYTKGNTNITEQLFEKIQVFLGPLKENKKLLKGMYEIRSRFLHGDLPLRPYGFESGYPDHEGKLTHAFYLSSMLLLATFQKMISKNLISLNFEYKLNSRA